MEYITNNVIRGFGLKAKNVYKHKASYICETNKGSKILKKSNLNLEEIIFQEKVKKLLIDNGFEKIDKFWDTPDGHPFYVYNHEIYTMYDNFPAKETDFSNSNEFISVIKEVAKLHGIFKENWEVILSYSGIIKNDITLYDSFKGKHNDGLNALVNIRKNLSKQKKLTDFDVIFLRNYNKYIDIIKKYEEYTNKNNLDSLKSNEIYLSHNLLKDEYILLGNNCNDIYITNFSECGFKHYIYDLVSITKRYFKSAEDNYLELDYILECYCHINPLSKSELDVFKAEMIYPENYLKLCSQYYSKKRTWIPSAFNARVEKIINKQQSYEVFIGLNAT